MSRLIVVMIAVVVLVVGGMLLLAGRARDKPQVHVEKVVTVANLQN